MRRADTRVPAMRRVLGLLAAMAILGTAPNAHAQVADSLLARVQGLVNAGNRAGARAIADSALTVRTPGTLAYAEALYARAYATSDAAAAERDYLRVGIEYPFSPRAEEAILMVGQFRQSRGDRAGARAQYERLAREFPRSVQAARANYWAGRLALEDGDVQSGCTYLFTASERVPRDDVELRNQIEYLRLRCMVPATAPVVTRKDSARADSGTKPTVQQKTEYSVQVAAFARKRDADALVGRLRARGFQVRLASGGAPYRVRVGWYATRADAVAAQARMKRARVSGIVVEAEPR